MTQSLHLPSPAAGLLQLARVKSGLSQEELAGRAGVPATMVSAYERSRRQPTLPTLLKLLRAAGFDLQMRLVPAEVHDEVLASLETTRTPADQDLRDRRIEAWRSAVPVTDR